MIMGWFSRLGGEIEGISFAHSRQAIPGLAPRGAFSDFTIL
jgi:hypothetical protein